MTFQVQAKICRTCIYRPGFGWRLAALLYQIRDPKMKGFFKGYRECHHAKRASGVCCRGFWNRHKDNFQAGQLAQRLGWVEFVNRDDLDAVLNLRQQCHPGAPVFAAYDKSDGTLTLTCAVCDGFATRILVARALQ